MELGFEFSDTARGRSPARDLGLSEGHVAWDLSLIPLDSAGSTTAPQKEGVGERALVNPMLVGATWG